jgi:DNA-binding SARP family transcriptional activator
MSSTQLELHFLGVARVAIGQNIKLTRKGLALLAFVALEGRTPREKIADLLWGELGTEGANRNLRRELHRLRETPLGAFLETQGSIGLRSFSADTNNLLLSGELLEGLILSDAPMFMEWLYQMRSRRNQLLLNNLRSVSLQTTDLEARLALQQQIWQLEPLSEPDAKALIQTLMQLGRAEEAKRVYKELAEQLKGIQAQPSLETAQALLPAQGSLLAKATLLEQLGRNTDTLDYRLQAAQEAKDNHLPLEALGHYAAALTLQKKAKQRFFLHQERLKLLIAIGQHSELENELMALEQNMRGDALLEARALVVKSSVQFQLLQFANSLQNAQLALENPLLPTTDQALAHMQIGVCSLRLGQLHLAEPHLTNALQQLGAAQFQARAQVHHAFSQLTMHQGQLDKARWHNQQAAESLGQIEDRNLRAGILGVSGILAMQQGQYDTALRLLETAKRECKDSQNTAALPMILINIAKAQIELGELDLAVQALEEGLIEIRQSGNRTMEGQLLNNLAVIHQERGHLGIALETYTAALEFATQIKDLRSMAFRQMSLADLLMQIGELKKAKQHLDQAKEMIGTTFPDLQPWWQIQQAEWLIKNQQFLEATRLLEPLHNHLENEIRLNAIFLSAINLKKQHQMIPKNLLLEHQQHPKWQIKILPLFDQLTPKQQALARANLHKAPALDQWRLHQILGQENQNLIKTLIASLESYPQLQQTLSLTLGLP